jgi:hypothetical protein
MKCMLKLSLWLTHSKYNNSGEKRKKRTKKITHRTTPTYNNQTTTHNNTHNHTQPTHSETYLCNTTYSPPPTTTHITTHSPLTVRHIWITPLIVTAQYQHEAITLRSRQLLMMGTWLPETCWATSRREIKNTKVTSSWFFLSTLNLF